MIPILILVGGLSVPLHANALPPLVPVVVHVRGAPTEEEQALCRAMTGIRKPDCWSYVVRDHSSDEGNGG